MLGYYTRDFRTSNVESAVDYMVLICLNADVPGTLGSSQASLCHEALRELVLETREFARLLGDIRPDGTRLKGIIEERLEILALSSEKEYLTAITTEAASVADDNGRTTDAVLLYHLSESYDNVIVVINRSLSEAIALDIGQEQYRLQPLKPRAETQHVAGNSSLSLTSVDDPVILAKNMMQLYNNESMYYGKIKPANREACGVLLRMSEAKAKVAGGDWSGAIDVSSNSHYDYLSPSSPAEPRISIIENANISPPHRQSTPFPSYPSKPMALSPRSAPPPKRSTPSRRPYLETSGPCYSGPSPPSANSAKSSELGSSAAVQAVLTRKFAIIYFRPRGI